jgi:predicted thioesterase
VRDSLRVGSEGRLERVVTPDLSAEQFGNVGVAVLATPALCALFEQSAVVAVRAALELGEATVGTHLEIDHLAATPLGRTVTVRARLEAVDGRRLTFTIEAHDGREMVARGRHERVVVELKRFLQKVAAKQATGP